MDPAVSSERLLPAASRVLLEQVRGTGTALPIKPLLKLLTLPHFSQAWTVEEKAWALGALRLVQSLNRNGWSFSSTSLSQADIAQQELARDEQVLSRVASIMPSLLTSLTGETYKEESLWSAWLQSLPLQGDSASARGWDSLALVITQPPALIDSLVKEKSGALARVFERAHASGAFDAVSEQALLGLLRLRTHGSSPASAQGEAAEQAWRQAWNALPGRPPFPTDEPWVETLLSKMDKAQARTWKAWALESNFTPTAPRKGPRF